MNNDSVLLLVLAGAGVYLYMNQQKGPTFAEKAGNAIGNAVGGAVIKVEQEIIKDAGTVKNFFVQKVNPFFKKKIPEAAKTVGHEVSVVAHKIDQEIKKDVNKVGSALKKVGGAIAGLFKKKRH